MSKQREKFMELFSDRGGCADAFLYLVERIKNGELLISSISYDEETEEKLGFAPEGVVTNIKQPTGEFFYTGETEIIINLYDNELARKFSHKAGTLNITLLKCSCPQGFDSDVRVRNYQNDIFWIGCEDCGRKTSNFKSRDEAIDQWNKMAEI